MDVAFEYNGSQLRFMIDDNATKQEIEDAKQFTIKSYERHQQSFKAHPALMVKKFYLNINPSEGQEKAVIDVDIDRSKFE